jgi:uncharacterized protein YaeQ
VALTSTIYTFDIDLSDLDRGVYETLSLKVAQHPSESAQYLVARVLAYCLEYVDGIGFSRGLSDPDEPTIAVRDLTGRLLAWIDVGTPDAARIHKASKAAGRAAVYVHKDPDQWLRQLAGSRIHNAAAVVVRVFDRPLIDAIVAELDRRMAFTLTVSEGHVLLATQTATIEGAVTARSLAS